MAKSKRRFTANMKVVRIDSQVALSTLGANALLGATMIAASESAYRLLSINLNALWSALGGSANGGLQWGIAFGDYSDTEIFECLTATAGINRGDKIALEKSNRWVRLFGYFDTVAALIDHEAIFNGGRALKKRINWLIPIGTTVKFFGWNSSQDAYTDGSILSLNGTVTVAYT